MFGGVVSGTSRQAYQAANGRAIDDGAAALRSHVVALMFHASPDATQIDGVNPIEFFARNVGSLNRRRLHAGIVERGIQPAEFRHGPFDRCGDIAFVGDVALNPDRLMASRHQFFGYLAHGVFAYIDQRDGRAGPCKSLRGGQTHAGCSAGDQRDLVLERQIH
jgi:hypothetical protein